MSNAFAAARLGYELLSNGKAGPRKTVVFLHGILGSLKNWRQPAQRVIGMFPHYQALLVDHRGHGQSEAGLPPHTLAGCALDVHALLQRLQLRPDILCGHSFGGKIALEYVKQGLDDKGGGIQVPRQTWVFDSLPTAVDRHKAIGENSVWDVIEKLGQVPLPQPSKEGLVSMLIEEKRIPSAIAHWLMTSLKRVPAGGGQGGQQGGLVWTFDLEVIRALFHAYTNTCYYDVMESPALSLQHHRIDFIQAGKNQAWTPEVLDRFAQIQALGRTNIGIHKLEKAGHWVHVDDLEGVLRLLAPTFLPQP